MKKPPCGGFGLGLCFLLHTHQDRFAVVAIISVFEPLKEPIVGSTTRGQLLERRGGDASGNGRARERLAGGNETLIRGHMTLSLPQEYNYTGYYASGARRI